MGILDKAAADSRKRTADAVAREEERRRDVLARKAQDEAAGQVLVEEFLQHARQRGIGPSGQLDVIIVKRTYDRVKELSGMGHPSWVERWSADKVVGREPSVACFKILDFYLSVEGLHLVPERTVLSEESERSGFFTSRPRTRTSRIGWRGIPVTGSSRVGTGAEGFGLDPGPSVPLATAMAWHLDL